MSQKQTHASESVHVLVHGRRPPLEPPESGLACPCRQMRFSPCFSGQIVVKLGALRTLVSLRCDEHRLNTELSRAIDRIRLQQRNRSKAQQVARGKIRVAGCVLLLTYQSCDSGCEMTYANI